MTKPLNDKTAVAFLKFCNYLLEYTHTNVAHLNPDFYLNATKWKLIIYKAQTKYKNGQTSWYEMDMLEDVNKKNETFLFLGNDTVAVRINFTMGLIDTSYYRKNEDTIFSRPPGPDTLLIETLTKDSLILMKRETDAEKTTVYNYHYAKAVKGN
ncbi:MAG: hypothetical protein WKF97_10620 [Chitinophagaceae bacterium]